MAPSREALRETYPELGIADEPPAWMTPETFQSLRAEPLWLDDEPPQGLLGVLLSDRDRD